MYQTMSYENQLKMKECQVRELLDGALNGTDYQWEEFMEVPLNSDIEIKWNSPLVMHIRMVR